MQMPSFAELVLLSIFLDLERGIFALSFKFVEIELLSHSNPTPLCRAMLRLLNSKFLNHFAKVMAYS